LGGGGIVGRQRRWRAAAVAAVMARREIPLVRQRLRR